MDRLKQMITGFNDEMHLSMAKSGRKQDLIDRIRSRMQFIKTQNDVAQWEKAKRVLYQVKVSGQ
jgi:E3 SUMO-protein ligase PIAS1